MDPRIHKIIKGSRANGPGIRNVVWFQGCTLGCSGCFNPHTHDPSGGRQITVKALCDELLDPAALCDGITVSGGEPFQQPDALLALLRELKSRKAPPILVFSGYTAEQLRTDPLRAACLPFIDALICGPYQGDKAPDYSRFCSSNNQELILFSDRFKIADFADLPLREVIIDSEGNAIISGIYS